MVVYHRKDILPSHISTKVSTIQIIVKERTLVQIGQEASPTPTLQEQGGEETNEKEKDRTKDSFLNMKLEELITI